jgi:hypothetical protein
VDIRLRYSADIALKHPWITQKFESQIPLTIYEEGVKHLIKHELINVVRSLFFVSLFERVPNVLRPNKPKDFVIKSSSAKKPPLSHSYRKTLDVRVLRSGGRDLRYFI